MSDEMVREILEAGVPPRAASPSMGVQLTKIRYSHDAMIDIIVENPWVHQNHLASHFGYSPAWISTVMATDMFKAKLAQRREEVVDPALKASLEERFRGVVETSLRVLHEKLSQPVVPDNLVLRAVELGAKALGLGGHAAPPPPTVNANEALNNLATRLLALQSQTRERMPYVEVIENGA